MSEPFLDDFDRDALLEQVGRMGVSEVMESNTWDLRPLEDFAQVATRDVVSVVRLPIRLGKHKVIVRSLAPRLPKYLLE